jgi:hypothetical protein
VVEVRAQGCDVRGGGGEGDVAAEGGGHVQRPIIYTEEQPVSIAASVPKEGWKINNVKIKFISQMS